MKVFFHYVTVFFLCLSFMACLPVIPPFFQLSIAMAAEPEKTTWKQQWDRIEAEAKKEGNLIIYTTAPGADLRKTSAAFTEKYGIKVDVFSARGPELTQKMETQRRAGMYLVDLIIAGGTNLAFLMKPRGFFDKFDNLLVLPEVTDRKAWMSGSFPYIDQDHYGINLIASIGRPFIRNMTLVKEGEVGSYKDLLKPKWKGKIVMNDPTINGGGNAIVGTLATIWGVENTREFLKQLIKQDLVITRDHRQSMEWVARGKYALGVGTSGEVLAEFLKIGAPISPVIASEGSSVSCMSYGLGIVNKRPDPNAATLFANWILSSKGNAILVNNAGLPGPRIDGPRENITPIFFPQAGERFFPTDEDGYKRATEMLKVAQDVFKTILK